MNTVPSSTYFSAPPDWGWLIVFYFFFGGLAGGCYFLGALIDLMGRPEDRPLARLGYYIAFPCVVLSGLLLTLDLTRPLRFWHMLIESNTYQPMFKPWSPMSLGSWALLIFGIFSLVSFLGALVEDNRLGMAGRAQSPPAGNAEQSDRRARRPCWFLRSGLHGSPPRRDEPPHLVGHASFGYAVRCFGGVDLGGVDDSPWRIDPDGPCPVWRPCTAWTPGWSRWN